MKSIHRFLSVAAAAVLLGPALASAQNSQTYLGNQSTGFGGALGESTLTVSDSASTGQITFSLALGSNATGFNDIGFYIDSTAGGIGDTSTLNDTGDEGRRALSGDSTVTGRTLVSFATGFNADYGVSLDSNGNANLFQLTAGNSLTYTPGASFTGPKGTNVYSFTVSESALGLTPGQSFSFVATLLNSYNGNQGGSDTGGVYRSNETIGASNVDNNSQGNLATTGTLSFSGFDTFATAVPEPATWLVGGLLVIAAGWTVSRSRRFAA